MLTLRGLDEQKQRAVKLRTRESDAIERLGVNEAAAGTRRHIVEQQTVFK